MVLQGRIMSFCAAVGVIVSGN